MSVYGKHTIVYGLGLLLWIRFILIKMQSVRECLSIILMTHTKKDCDKD